MNHHHRHRVRRAANAGWTVPTAVLAAMVLLAGCGSDDGATGTTDAGTVAGGSAPGSAASSDAGGTATAGDAGGTATAGDAGGTETAPVGGTVTLITHDSFNMDPKVLQDFEDSENITVELLAQGDAGAMVNKLVLTKDNPIGDVVFGIDNTFASRALDAGVLQPYTSPEAAGGAETYSIDPEHRLTAVDYGDVCINVDHRWFGEHDVPEPSKLEDLTDPAYADLLVVPSPATSSPGLAFLLGTIAHFGDDGWQDYWTALKDNGLKVTSGWEDAYTVDFSGSSGHGDRPLVLSYASSPPYEMTDDDDTAPTGALLDTCFRQVEYAGVLAGSDNPEAAGKVVDLLLSEPFQSALPEQMYVYPVDPDVTLPESWAEFAPPAPDPATMDPATISEHREQWITTWTDLVGG